MPFYWHCCGCCCIFFLVCFLLQAKRDICQLCEKSSQFFAKFVNNHRKIHWISKQKKKITRIINECSQCELHINHRNNNFDGIKKNCEKKSSLFANVGECAHPISTEIDCKAELEAWKRNFFTAIKHVLVVGVAIALCVLPFFLI